MMRSIKYLCERVSSLNQINSEYAISFGSSKAPHQLELFYGIKCKKTQRFIRNDLPEIMERFVNTGQISLRCYPAALDKQTLLFAQNLKKLSEKERRAQFMLLQNHSTNNWGEMHLKGTLSEKTFFDIARLMYHNFDISSAPNLSLNGRHIRDSRMLALILNMLLNYSPVQQTNLLGFSLRVQKAINTILKSISRSSNILDKIKS
jgi:hypothetical protein